jgi:hypothetical protein
MLGVAGYDRLERAAQIIWKTCSKNAGQVGNLSGQDEILSSYVESSWAKY